MAAGQVMRIVSFGVFVVFADIHSSLSAQLASYLTYYGSNFMPIVSGNCAIWMESWLIDTDTVVLYADIMYGASILIIHTVI